MMWFFLLFCIARIEPVDLQGTDRLVLRGGSNPCEGQLEIYHDNIWGYVGDTNWDASTEQVVCRSTQCGDPLSAVDTIRELDKKVWLDEMKCEGRITGQLWECENPGFGATIYRLDHMKWMKCSHNIKISLEGYKCAGAVKYTDGTTEGYFCGDTWDKDETDVLCESLGCGTSKEIPKDYWEVPEKFKDSKKMVVNCSGIRGLDNLWQCAQQPNQKCSIPAFVICKDHKRLQIKGEQSNVCQGELQIEENGQWTDYKPEDITAEALCNQMYCGEHIIYTAESGKLNCSENVSVSLLSKGSTSKCYGEVHIKKNNIHYPVCDTTWSKKDAEVVCKELNCGGVISVEKLQRGDNNPNDNRWIMDNVNCTGGESSLWYCKAKRNNIKCSSKAFVVCTGSIEVRLEDGPGKCAGRVEIKYEGQWQRATDDKWITNNSKVVCQSLNCGEHQSNNTETFSKGSAKFLDKVVECQPSDSNISDCIRDNAARSDKPVMITCTERKMVFLEKQCSGRVGIESGTTTSWLSGYNKMWNKESADAVCRQMHCGESSSHGYNPKTGEKVWPISYNCSSNATSLYDCNETRIQNDTFATVNCSGNIIVNLTRDCWGNVNVCLEGTCGGVCNDTWTTDKSKMLCKNLQCGIPQVLGGLNPHNDYKVIVKSLHTAKGIRNLNQSNIVKYEIEDSTCKPAYVVCSGSVKARLSTTRSKCSGNVLLEFEGRWLPVCTSALDDTQTQNIICEQQQCGRSMTVLDFGPKEAGAPAIQQITCKGKESLKECEITASNKECTLGGLQCSSWRKMEVKFNASCSGYVYVYSQGKKSAVSFEGWNRTEGERLCKDLNCGKFISGQGENTRAPFWNGTFSCGSQNPENIWDCEKDLSSPQQQQLYIKCQDEPIVNLTGNCSGEVTINNINVCQSNDKPWNIMYSDLVCKERNCSHAISFNNKTTNGDIQEYQHVRCEDYHGKLGQCNRFKGKCNGGLVTVNCVKSINFVPFENCKGVIQVNYQNKPEKVCLEKVPSHLLNDLCGTQDCGLTSKLNTFNKEKLNWALNCSNDCKSIQHCVKRSEVDCTPTEIICTQHVAPTTQAPPTQTIEVVPIILGVGLTLIVVILIVVFVRVCIVRRAKRPMYAASRTFEREEVEFESGDYEDVKGKANEMEALSQGMFRSNSDVIMESDGRSNTSLPYDDIDDEVKAQTSPAATAAASGEKFFREGALAQSSDGVTYEVDDPQENYDDIEASPEISQIKAEVHNSPEITPENVVVTPSGLVRRDEDYLVPGQDG